MRSARAIITGAVVITAIAVSTALAAAPAHMPMSTRAALLSKATALASSAGDAHPSSIEVVYTNERRYLLVENPGGGGRSRIAPRTPVYFIALRGHFGCPRCIRPATVLSTAYLAHGLAPANPVAYRTTYPRLRLAGSPIKLKR
jgi:hypothetical protein